MKLRISMMVISLGSLIACGKDDSDGASMPSAPFITAHEMERPSNTSPIESIDLHDVLQANLDLFRATEAGSALRFEEEDPGSFEKFAACTKEVTDQFRVKASGSSLTFVMNADLTKCFALSPQTANGAQITFNEYKSLAYFALECTGADFSTFDGKTLTEFSMDSETTESCKLGGSLLNNGRTTSIYTLTSSSTGQSQIIKTLALNSMSTSDVAACKIDSKDSVLSYGNACLKVSVISAIGGTEDSVDYRHLAYGDVTWKNVNEESWYSSGTMTASVNNWSGQVVYSGADTNPQYSFNNGTETIAGSLGFSLLQAPRLLGLPQ